MSTTRAAFCQRGQKNIWVRIQTLLKEKEKNGKNKNQSPVPGAAWDLTLENQEASRGGGSGGRGPSRVKSENEPVTCRVHGEPWGPLPVGRGDRVCGGLWERTSIPSPSSSEFQTRTRSPTVARREWPPRGRRGCWPGAQAFWELGTVSSLWGWEE